MRTDDVLVLLPRTPLTLARSREACTPSRATDEPTDAALQLALRLTPRDTLPPLPPQSPTRRALAQRVAHRRRVVGATVRSTKRLTSTLQNAVPQVLPWCQDNAPPRFCDFWSRWPTLNAAHRARPSPLATFCRDHHGRSADVVAQRRHAIQAARPLTTEAGVLAPHAVLVQALVNQLRVPLEAMATLENASAPRAQRHPDCPLFPTRPGAGPVCASRLLVAFGDQRARDGSAAARHKEAGSAPVTARRGPQSWGHGRLQCPKCLRQTFVAWAAASLRHAFWAWVYDQQQRDQGTAHQAAVRSLAGKWLRVLCRCWQDRTPSEEATSLHALNRRGSSLLHHLAQEA